MDKAEAVDTLQSVIEVLGCDFVLGYIKAQKEMLKMNEKTPGKMREYIIWETTYPFATGQEVVGELVRCKDCKHRPSGDGADHNIEFPDDLCPCQCEDFWYSWIPSDDWFCGNGERRE